MLRRLAKALYSAINQCDVHFESVSIQASANSFFFGIESAKTPVMLNRKE